MVGAGGVEAGVVEVSLVLGGKGRRHRWFGVVVVVAGWEAQNVHPKENIHTRTCFRMEAIAFVCVVESDMEPASNLSCWFSVWWVYRYTV